MKTMRSILLFTYHIWSIKTNCQKRSCQKCASVKVANTFPTTLTCIVFELIAKSEVVRNVLQ